MSPADACQVICTGDTYVAFEVHTSSWHIYGNSKDTKVSFSCFLFDLFVNGCGLYIYTTAACSGTFMRNMADIFVHVTCQ